MPTAERPSFRRRLLAQLGAALTFALALVGVAVWGGVAARSTHEARRALRAEAHAVEAAAVTPGGHLRPRRYDWSEPHHRYSDRRLDPYFLQVFDRDGRLLRASLNTAGGPLPQHALARTDGDGLATPLARLPDRRFYRITEALRASDGREVGVVQIARHVPTVPAHLGRLAAALVLALGSLLAALLALVWGIGGRVVRPLAALTAHAEGLSAATLGARVPVPPDADREAAALAAALNGALVRLDAAFDQMQRFTADASHELQTPLTVLRGHVDVALRRERTPESYRETLRVLASEAEAMTTTVRGLLALARLDADAGLDTARVDLADVARAEAETFRALAETRGLALGVHADAAPVAGHSDLLREMVRTLLDNAVKYTASGHVAVATGASEGQAWVAVEDTGPGMAPEHRARATSRFWRGPDVQAVPGSGLGLALAQRIAERHGGALVLDAAPGGGLRATVRLPAG